MTNKYIQFGLLSVLAAVLSGCGMNIAIIDNTVIPDAELTSARNLKLMDRKGPIFIREVVSDDGANTYKYSPNKIPMVDMPAVATADFHLSEFYRNHYMVVKGELENGNTYPVILDTGANLDTLIVQDIHIRENNLRVFPLKKHKGPEGKMSLCAVDQLKIGNFKIKNCTGISWGQHVELKFLGLIPLGRSEDICFPLPMMNRFKYFKFDIPGRQVQFSMRKSFDPQTEDKWHQFPMRIESHKKDSSKQFLYLDMEINGKRISPLLDTGAGLGFMMNSRLWNGLKSSFVETGRRNTNFILPYHFEDNKPNCTAVKVKNLNIDDMHIKNAEITVLPESKNWKKAECIMGMGYFRDKIVVLDFEKKIMWVRKH